MHSSRKAADSAQHNGSSGKSLLGVAGSASCHQCRAKMSSAVLMSRLLASSNSFRPDTALGLEKAIIHNVRHACSGWSGTRVDPMHGAGPPCRSLLASLLEAPLPLPCHSPRPHHVTCRAAPSLASVALRAFSFENNLPCSHLHLPSYPPASRATSKNQVPFLCNPAVGALVCRLLCRPPPSPGSTILSSFPGRLAIDNPAISEDCSPRRIENTRHRATVPFQGTFSYALILTSISSL